MPRPKILVDARPILEFWSGVPVTAAAISRAFLTDFRDRVEVIFWANSLRGSDDEICQKLASRLGFEDKKIVENFFCRTRIPSKILDGFFAAGLPLEKILPAKIPRPDRVFAPDAALPIRARAPVGIFVHDLASIHFSRFFSKKHRLRTRLFLRKNLRRGAKLFSNSEFTAWDLEKNLGLRATPVGLGADHAAPPDPAETAAAREKFALPEKFFAAVGTLEPRKNLHAALEIWPEIFEKTGAGLAVLGGENPTTFARGSGSFPQKNPGVKFLGPVPDREKWAILAGSAGLVFPSFFEGFSLPALEAARLGIPVAAARAPGVVEAAGPAAEFFDPENRAEMTRAVRKILDENPADRAARIAAGKKFAAEKTWTRVAGKILDGLGI